jgi:hypothetical protein
MSNIYVGPDAGGVNAIRATTPREVLRHNLFIADVGRVVSTAVDLFGGVDSKEIRAGTLMAKITASGKWTPWLGADVVSAVAIASVVLNVGVAAIARFAVGDVVKTSKPTADSIVNAAEQTLGAIATLYATSGTFAVSNAQVVSAIAVGDTVWVEPATDTGIGDAIGVLLDNVLLRLGNGVACERDARIAQFGFLKTDQLLGLAGRAKLTLAGQGLLTPSCLLFCD